MTNGNSPSCPLEPFIGTRAEIFTNGEAPAYYGWVTAIQVGRFTIQISGTAEIKSDNDYRIKLSCAKSTCELTTQFLGLNGGNFVFATPAIIRLSPPEGVLRKQSPIKMSQIFADEEWHDAPLVDVSPGGFSVLTDLSLEQNQVLEAKLIAPDGSPLKMTVSVVYCRFDQETQKFRVGFQTKVMGRIEGARWAKLMAS